MVMLDNAPHSTGAVPRLSADITISPSPSPSLGTAAWHVAVTRPGQFPMYEARCPCDKAPCGLVIPRLDVPCDVHNAYASLHQAHSSEDCRAPRHGRAARGSGRRFSFLRQGRG